MKSRIYWLIVILHDLAIGFIHSLIGGGGFPGSATVHLTMTGTAQIITTAGSMPLALIVQGKGTGCHSLSLQGLWLPARRHFRRKYPLGIILQRNYIQHLNPTAIINQPQLAPIAGAIVDNLLALPSLQVNNSAGQLLPI